jgi:hypothetical protein
VARAAHVRAVASRAERLEGARLDLPGVVALHGVHAVVVVEHEAVLEPFGIEEASFLRDPFLQPAVGHDLERHP